MMKQNIHHCVNVRRHLFRREFPQDTSLDKYGKLVKNLLRRALDNRKERAIQERTLSGIEIHRKVSV